MSIDLSQRRDIHFWGGELITDDCLSSRVAALRADTAKLLAKKLDLGVLLGACQRMSDRLLTDAALKASYRDELVVYGQATSRDVDDTLLSMAEFLTRENLLLKLARELGSKNPFSPQRTTHADHVFECWAPVGFLVHASPTNAFSVGVLSVVEGLLAGNVNFLKASASDCLFPIYFLRDLAACDDTGTLKDFIFVARISSRRREDLDVVFSLADGVAAWGGEESIEGLRSLTPRGARFVDWGPKISFAYVCKSRLSDPMVIRELSQDICVFDQQACSSPQVVYAETDDRDVLDEFAARLSEALAVVSAKAEGLKPDLQEQAEITSVTELAFLGSCIGENKVYQAEDKSWRVLVEYKPGLRASPLFRSIWVKPLPRSRVIETLHPLRSYLQTVGLAGDANEVADLASIMTKAGLLRMTMLGAMHKSYVGEPHDGRYALQAYTRKISFQFDDKFVGISNLDDLTSLPFIAPSTLKPKVMTKEDFQNAVIDDRYAQLFFKSGGSSGDPKLSVFTYDDYHAQMAAAAQGLYAAGLDPITDRCMNLFFGGGLYGGFVSFFSILEFMKAVQMPMAVVDDYAFVVDMILKKKVSVLLGMPSFLIQLFGRESKRLREYKGIKKVFYGGEHFNAKQMAYLKADFGVELVKSATYGSVDAGPLGYQCLQCEGGVHHLHTALQDLEILKIDRDEPVAPGETGRLVFSSKMRQGQSIVRYDIGDLGKWQDGACGCGRVSPRFELLGRHGDICRVATIYLNYRKIVNLVSDYFNYTGELQILIEHRNLKDRLEIRMASVPGYGTHEVRRLILNHYKDLGEVVSEGLTNLDIVFVRPHEFLRTSGSGKLRHLIDER